ncbi:MAG: sigma-70 family RNA polymerase sigma factor [Acidobacteriota bacterium]|nr:sigma-70 family RNA polymerase sigma factor [Acidobacteriota bacterium]
MSEQPGVTERDLILRTQRGETAAFGDLVNRYMRRAYFAALGFVGSSEDAYDLSQDAFVRAFNARDRINPDMPFYTWFYQILRRLCYNFNRDRKLHREKLKQAKPWLEDHAGWLADQRNPHQQVQRVDLQKRVQEGIASLGEKDREILVLKEFEDLKYREIAELLDIPIGTVMSRLYSARRHLATALEEEG